MGAHTRQSSMCKKNLATAGDSPVQTHATAIFLNKVHIKSSELCEVHVSQSRVQPFREAALFPFIRRMSL